MKLLLVESSVARAIALADSLEGEGAEVLLAHTFADAVHHLTRSRPGAVVIDASLFGKGAEKLVQTARELSTAVRIIIINATEQLHPDHQHADAILPGNSAREIVAILRRLAA